MFAESARTLDGRLLVGAGALDSFAAHALREYPNECIGYIDPRGEYVPMRNVASEPAKYAVIDRHALAGLIATEQLTALCHSHPGGPECPSQSDMAAQIELAVPFLLIATNGQACSRAFAWGDELLDNDDIVGRSFRHGVRDCYALIRLWYARERGAVLPDYPRQWEWWNEAVPGEKDLYRRFFADAGFSAADRSAPREGDVWLAAIRSDVPNHAGIYLDGGLALHHPSSGLAYDPGRLSKRESIARWAPWITHWLRRD